MNSVFKGINGKWYFWDETETYDYGPYDTEEEATRELFRYCKQLIES